VRDGRSARPHLRIFLDFDSPNCNAISLGIGSLTWE
jgi:hypothetical protein